jgi:hypothetical protein
MPKFGKYTTAPNVESEFDITSDECAWRYVLDERGKVVGAGISENPFNNKEDERSRLFAASPEMYEVIYDFVQGGWTVDLYKRMEAILSKVDGDKS